MKTILIFDQAECSGGSINRAVELAEKLNEFNFIFLTFHSLDTLNSATSCLHIKSKRIFSFYNSKTAAAHNNWLNIKIKNSILKNLISKIIYLAHLINKFITISQALTAIKFRRIDIVQANCGFHPLPYHLARLKKSDLVYYFRDLQNYKAIAPSKIAYASRYIFVCEKLMEEYQNQLQLPHKKCFMIRSPFDVDERINKQNNYDLSIPNQLRQNGKKIIILSSRICKDKGQHIALQAIKLLSKKHTEFVLLLAGKADPDIDSKNYLRSLIDYVKTHKLEQYVHFLGHRDDILHLMRHADISLQTPIYFEAMAGALLESLQLGIPTVAADVGGTHEAIVDHRTGFLFPAGDAKKLTDILLMILDGKATLNPIIDLGKTHARVNWSPARVKQQMKAIYLHPHPHRRHMHS
jgi:glycosyltransferase involved in cell wall biosynthesis